jgi:GT2 family glycosyltransferase
LSPNDTYPEHIVTAVIVAHDGAEWLPRVIEALHEQTHPVHRILAVDAGSRDRSGVVLAGLLGPDAVFGMDRDAGYGTSVASALRHPAAAAPVPGPPGFAAEWIWLLHDDCAPAPDALAELLRGAAETPAATVLGPKVLDWSDQRVILEAGLAIDTAGRRVSGVEPREIDQGQHDGDRDVLAVSSAGMLARRDVWDEVGGFDTGLALFREDVDFCWRVHAAGYRVRLITDAVVYHVEASGRGRRDISAVPHPRRADRRNALFVLLANLPLTAMIAAAVGNTALSTARILFFLLAKRAEAARDEAAALGSLAAHPARLLRARRRRRMRGHRRAYGALRSQVPRGQSVRKLLEFVAATLYPSSRVEATGSHHASEDPSDDDSLLIDSGLAQRILTNPGILLFTGLLVISLIAERSLLGPGPLGGGTLLPAWGGASGLWSQYLAGFHTIGIGSAASTPPYIAVLAAVSTILGGKPWLAVEVILLGCVPLSGLTAYLTSRRFSEHVGVRVWLAASYALLPVATGVVAAGRLGTAVVFILVPLIVSAAGRMLTEPGRRARRFAWATGLLIALAAAFVPLVWAMAVIIAAFAGLAFARTRRAMAINLAIVALVPPVLLAPWTLSLAEHPSALLLEAGLQAPGLASRDLPASSLLLINPGGPGTPPVWVGGGLLLAALAALLMRRHWFNVATAWGVALSGLLAAIAVSRFLVSTPTGGPAEPAWPGAALIVAALGLLLAVAAVGNDLYALAAGGGLRRVGAGLMIVVACAPPVLAAGYWVARGVQGPVTRISGPVLPEYVSVSSATGAQLRTLVLRPQDGVVDYSVLRGTDPPLGSTELAEPPAAARQLTRVVAALAAPDGSQTGDLGSALAQFAIGYVLLPAPVDPALAGQIDGAPGLRPVSQTPSFQLWRVSGTVARVTVTEPNGTRVALPSGSLNVSGATAPSAGGTLVLAEPASASWHATLNGRALTPLAAPVDGWAQGFRLPAGGGTLNISRDETGRTIVVALEFLAVFLVALLALPGSKQSTAEETGVAGRGRRTGRASRAARSGPVDEGSRPGRASRLAAAGAASRPGRARRAADQPAGAGRVSVADRVGAMTRGGGSGRRGTRNRDQQQPAARRAGRGARTQGRRRRGGPDGANSTGPHRVPDAARGAAPPDWQAEDAARTGWVPRGGPPAGRQQDTPPGGWDQGGPHTGWQQNAPQGGQGHGGPPGGWQQDGPHTGWQQNAPQGGQDHSGPPGGWQQGSPQREWGQHDPQAEWGQDDPRAGWQQDGPPGGWQQDGPPGEWGQDGPAGGWSPDDGQDEWPPQHGPGGGQFGAGWPPGGPVSRAGETER